jgi:hypothetical protein
MQQCTKQGLQQQLQQLYTAMVEAQTWQVAGSCLGGWVMDALTGACSSPRALLGVLLGTQINNCSSNNCSSSSCSSGHLAALQQQLLQQQQRTPGRSSIMIKGDAAGGRDAALRDLAAAAAANSNCRRFSYGNSGYL